MTGLVAWFGSMSEADVAARTSSAGRQPALCGRTHDVRNVACDNLHIIAWPGPLAFSSAVSPGMAVSVFGRLASTPGNPRNAEDVLALAERRGIDDLVEIDGAYLLLVLDRALRQLCVQTDRIGSVQCYWRVDGGVTTVATEAKALAGDTSPLQVDDDALLLANLFGRAKFSRKPPFRNAEAVPPGGRMTAAAGRAPVCSRYFRYDPAAGVEGHYEAMVDEAVAVLRERVNLAIENAAGRVAFGLSGGMDARMLAAAISPSNRDRVLAVSFGMRGNNESAIARQIAAQCRLAYLDVELQPEHFIMFAEKAIATCEGQDLFAQGYLLYVLPMLAEEHGAKAFLDGMEIGVTLGGDWLPSPGDPVAVAESLPRWLAGKYAITKDPPEDYLVSVPQWLVDLDPIAGALAENEHASSRYDLLDCVLTENVVREVMRFRYRLTRKVLDPISIVPERGYQEMMMRIPNRWRAKRRFQRAMLQAMAPAMLDIPYHRTMAPLSAPADVREASAKALAEEEARCQQLWRDRRELVPFNHYFSNFSQWFRAHPSMVKFVRTLLVADDCRLHTLFRPDWVKRTVDDHVTGVCDNRNAISYLVGTELFLRRFQD